MQCLIGVTNNVLVTGDYIQPQIQSNVDGRLRTPPTRERRVTRAAAGAESDCRYEVREKLVEIYKNSGEDLCRLLFFLAQHDEVLEEDAAVNPYWKSLKALLGMDDTFKQFADRLVEDTKTAEKDPKFQRIMHEIYSNYMTHSETPLPEDADQGFVVERLDNLTVTQRFGFAGLARAWALIPSETQARILDLIPIIARNNRIFMTTVDEFVSVVNRAGGTVVMFTLAAVYLCCEAIKNIRRWWKGKISGKRCVKNIIDASVTSAAGIGGGIGGAALGTFISPGFGTVVGGIAGGIVSAHLASLISDRLTQSLFGLPKDEAVENAYRYLGVPHTASNAQVNTAFRKLCLKHHPHKGGNREEFFILQNYMAVIKMARGDM